MVRQYEFPSLNNLPAPVSHLTTVGVGARRMTIEDVVALAQQRAIVELSSHPDWLERIDRGADYLRSLLQAGTPVYGVNTGYGEACVVPVPPELIAELPRQLLRFLGCGMGEYLDAEQTLAVMACRLNSLAQGHSGVRRVVLEGLTALINRRILPRIPSEGSVGASGDLAPLSYLASALVGERDVVYQGRICPAAEALREAGVSVLKLAPKEGLALINGTAVMTGLACLAWRRAEYLTRLACRLTSMATVALNGRPEHFDAAIFEAKPHIGQGQAAAWMRADLAGRPPQPESRLQDPYSIRCAPHVIGVARDALGWMRRDIENEINSANDNPLIDADGERVLHGGNFYGGHIAFVMDALKIAVANLADLMDRQMALLVDDKFSHGLPRNLSGAAPERRPINHGLKGVQIATSAWTAEALKMTMPASVFSRSTEAHNQDKVSMGTIAARDCLRVLTLTEQVAAAHALATTQAVTLRLRIDAHLPPLAGPLDEFAEQVNALAGFVDEDRPLDADLDALTGWIRNGATPLYVGVV